jgi:hypothetical protein
VCVICAPKQPTKFELAIHVRTAKQLDLTISQSLFAHVGRLIEQGPDRSVPKLCPTPAHDTVVTLSFKIKHFCTLTRTRR